MKATYEGKCRGRHSAARFNRDPYNVLISEAREALKALTGCDYRLPPGIKHVGLHGRHVRVARELA